MHRFYKPNADLTTNSVELTDPKEIHHLSNVLRLKANDEIVIFDGKGQEALATIRSVAKHSVIVTINESRQISSHHPRIIIACAVPKKAKFEFIIEKLTEIGVDEIIPLKTARTELKLSEDRLMSKSTRYQKVAVNAAKQSQRLTIPMIHPITPLLKTIETLKVTDSIGIVPCLSGDRKDLFDILSDMKNTPETITFFIGPEGDFTPQEVDACVKAGCLTASLGTQVLKVDTAALACASFTRFFFKL